jgi:hypothetical protein
VLTSCDKHDDYLVIYDTPILRDCPVCLSGKEYHGLEKEYSDLEEEMAKIEKGNESLKLYNSKLEVEIKQIKEINELKEQQIINLREEVSSLRKQQIPLQNRR